MREAFVRDENTGQLWELGFTEGPQPLPQLGTAEDGVQVVDAYELYLYLKSRGELSKAVCYIDHEGDVYLYNKDSKVFAEEVLAVRLQGLSLGTAPGVFPVKEFFTESYGYQEYEVYRLDAESILQDYNGFSSSVPGGGFSTAHWVTLALALALTLATAFYPHPALATLAIASQLTTGALANKLKHPTTQQALWYCLLPLLTATVAIFRALHP